MSDRNVSVIGISDLGIIWDLEFENRDFRLAFREITYFSFKSAIVCFDVALSHFIPSLENKPQLWYPGYLTLH